jgi:hypothetical protein
VIKKMLGTLLRSTISSELTVFTLATYVCFNTYVLKSHIRWFDCQDWRNNTYMILLFGKRRLSWDIMQTFVWNL